MTEDSARKCSDDALSSRVRFSCLQRREPCETEQDSTRQSENLSVVQGPKVIEKDLSGAQLARRFGLKDRAAVLADPNAMPRAPRSGLAGT